MAEKMLDDKEFSIIRFACDCGSQGHSLDFYILRDESGKAIECSVSLFLAGKPSLSWRIKTAWYSLLGKGGELGDLIIRPEDYAEMVKLGAELTKNPNTSGT